MIVVVLGTRPEIVKLAPVIGAFHTPPLVIHTGQHYDPNMADEFFDAFGLDVPSHRLAIGGSTRGQQIGNAVSQLDSLFSDLTPSVIVVQGDTNSTMAAALAGNAASIPVAHVEAGLRSHDRRMPEEHNRVVTDHLSDLCLAPTEVSAENLRDEGIPDDRIRVTGNTVVDAVRHLLPSSEARARVLGEHSVDSGGFILSTFHRPENVDDPSRLQVIIDELATLDLPVVLPIHPRTRTIAETHGVDLEPGGVVVTEPLGYVEFLSLLAECRLAVSDSGGLQEEVSVLQRPMVVVRNSTERTEVLGTFCTLVSVGDEISNAGRRWLAGEPYSLEELATMHSPYGEGDSGERSAKEIEALLAT